MKKAEKQCSTAWLSDSGHGIRLSFTLTSLPLAITVLYFTLDMFHA